MRECGVKLSLRAEHVCVYPPVTLELCPLIFLLSPNHIWTLRSVALRPSRTTRAGRTSRGLTQPRTINIQTHNPNMELRIVRLAWANSQRHLCDGEPHFLCVRVCVRYIPKFLPLPVSFRVAIAKTKGILHPSVNFRILSALNCDITENMRTLS